MGRIIDRQKGYNWTFSSLTEVLQWEPAVCCLFLVINPSKVKWKSLIETTTLHNAILMQTLFRKMLYFFCPYLGKEFQCLKFSPVCIDEFKFCSRASRCLAWNFIEEEDTQLKQKMKTLMVRWSVRLL